MGERRRGDSTCYHSATIINPNLVNKARPKQIEQEERRRGDPTRLGFLSLSLNLINKKKLLSHFMNQILDLKLKVKVAYS
ncbi:hypothetical protein LguiA_006652 [Lonicera macranthoides]